MFRKTMLTFVTHVGICRKKWYGMWVNYWPYTCFRGWYPNCWLWHSSAVNAQVSLSWHHRIVCIYSALLFCCLNMWKIISSQKIMLGNKKCWTHWSSVWCSWSNLHHTIPSHNPQWLNHVSWSLMVSFFWDDTCERLKMFTRMMGHR